MDNKARLAMIVHVGDGTYLSGLATSRELTALFYTVDVNCLPWHGSVTVATDIRDPF